MQLALNWRPTNLTSSSQPPAQRQLTRRTQGSLWGSFHRRLRPLVTDQGHLGHLKSYDVTQTNRIRHEMMRTEVAVTTSYDKNNKFWKNTHPKWWRQSEKEPCGTGEADACEYLFSIHVAVLWSTAYSSHDLKCLQWHHTVRHSVWWFH